VKTRLPALIAGLALTASAGGLSGEFKFNKKAPSVALVYFSEDHSAKGAGPTVDQKDKQFTAKMMVGTSGSKIRFNNSDSVDHNIYANDSKAGVNFDAGLLPPGQTSQAEVTWKEEEVIKIGCKIHPKMQAYIANIASAHHKIVEFESKDAGGSFALANVPDKLTKVRVWFPKQDPVDVEIKKGETKEVEIKEKGQSFGTLKLVRK
jgi:plastocyanin